MSGRAARRSKVAKIRWAQGFRPNVFWLLRQKNPYGLSAADCVMQIDESGPVIPESERADFVNFIKGEVAMESLGRHE